MRALTAGVTTGPGRNHVAVLAPYVLIAAALALGAVVAINAVLFYGRLVETGRTTCDPSGSWRDPAYSRPSHALNPLPLVFKRCGLSSDQITDAYASPWGFPYSGRPLAVGWSFSLAVSGAAFLAGALLIHRISPAPRPMMLGRIGLLCTAASLLIAGVISLLLLVQTGPYGDALANFQARYGSAFADLQALTAAISNFTDRYGAVQSTARLSMTTWNPLQQVLVFAIAPIGIALTLAGLLSSLGGGSFRVIALRLGFLCAVLLLAGPVVAIFPNSFLRVLFAIGLGAAPFALAFLGVLMPRSQNPGPA